MIREQIVLSCEPSMDELLSVLFTAFAIPADQISISSLKTDCGERTRLFCFVEGLYARHSFFRTRLTVSIKDAASREVYFPSAAVKLCALFGCDGLIDTGDQADTEIVEGTFRYRVMISLGTLNGHLRKVQVDLNALDRSGAYICWVKRQPDCAADSIVE